MLKFKAGLKLALTKFFSTFGLPKVVQTDQGTHFMSRLFKQVLSQLNIKHEVSSAYHPESQGALERFHQTLKSMLLTFCAQSEKEWDEGLPLLLFAECETQESLGFSPAELVFGHTVSGPLKLLKEKMMGCKILIKDLLSQLSYLSEAFRADICQLIQSYLTMFSDVPSRTTAVCHDIDVGDHPPIKQHAYRVNPIKRQVIQDEVKYLLENGLAVQSSSSWSSPASSFRSVFALVIEKSMRSRS